MTIVVLRAAIDGGRHATIREDELMLVEAVPSEEAKSSHQDQWCKS